MDWHLEVKLTYNLTPFASFEPGYMFSTNFLHI